MKNETIYLDNCSYNRPFDDQKQIRISLETQAKLYIQFLIKSDALDLVYSYVCFYENYINPFENKKLAISEFSQNAKYCVIENRDILLKANEIIKNGIQSLDALHLSCAINAEADYFITVDDSILKYSTDDIKILDPIMFIKYWESRRGKDD